MLLGQKFSRGHQCDLLIVCKRCESGNRGDYGFAGTDVTLN